MAVSYPETHEVDLWQVQYRSIASDTVNRLKFKYVNRTFTVYFSNIRLFLKQKIMRKNIKIIVFQPFQFKEKENKQRFQYLDLVSVFLNLVIICNRHF